MSATDLSAVEVFNTLSRCLDLSVDNNISYKLCMRDRITKYLDCKCTDSGNHVEGSSQHTVVGSGGIIFPDSCRILDSCNICNVAHNINVPKVDNVSQATTKKVN